MDLLSVPVPDSTRLTIIFDFAVNSGLLEIPVMSTSYIPGSVCDCISRPIVFISLRPRFVIVAESGITERSVEFGDIVIWIVSNLISPVLITLIFAAILSAEYILNGVDGMTANDAIFVWVVVAALPPPPPPPPAEVVVVVVETVTVSFGSVSMNLDIFVPLYLINLFAVSIIIVCLSNVQLAMLEHLYSLIWDSSDMPDAINE